MLSATGKRRGHFALASTLLLCCAQVGCKSKASRSRGESALQCVDGRSKLSPSPQTPISCPPGTTLQRDVENQSEACVDAAGHKQGLSRWLAAGDAPSRGVAPWHFELAADVKLREWVDNQLDGLATDYVYGAKSLEGRFKHGMADGVWCQWDKDSLLGQYSMDMGTGTETLWHGKDRPAMQRELVSGVAQGPFHAWHAETGAKALEGQFVDGLADGKWTQYDWQGVALGSYLLRKGSGIERIWSDAGKLESEVPWVRGKKQGPSIVYWPNGQVMKETAYQEGKRHGSESFYTEDGKLESKRQWVQGRDSTTTTP